MIQQEELLRPVDDVAIASRRRELFDEVEAKAHERSKNKELDLFSGFLAARSTASLRRASVFEATPEDVVDFLIYRDLEGTGKTKVHERTCIVGTRDGTCDCPTRLGQSMVHQAASKIRTRLAELGAGGEWSSVAFSGNPADSSLVRKYVTAIKEEQARAGVVAVAAREKAMLPGALEQLVTSIRHFANVSYASNKITYLEALQDLAWITIQYRSLNRGAELSALRVDNTAVGPNDSCLLFQFMFSKVLRGGGSTHEFGVPARPGDVTCPVGAFKQYVAETTRLLHWDWDSDTRTPVFAVIGHKGVRTSVPVAAATMGRRFARHKSRCMLDLGAVSACTGVESLHGLRAGGALDRALKGDDLKEIMLQGFWKKPATALHYIGMLEAIAGPEFAAAMRVKSGTVGPAAPEGRPTWAQIMGF